MPVESAAVRSTATPGLQRIAPTGVARLPLAGAIRQRARRRIRPTRPRDVTRAADSPDTVFLGDTTGQARALGDEHTVLVRLDDHAELHLASAQNCAASGCGRHRAASLYQVDSVPLRFGDRLPTGKRVQWTEVRHVQGTHEAFFMRAEKDGDVWRVFERSTFESLWCPVESTPAVIAKCEREFASQRKSGGESM